MDVLDEAGEEHLAVVFCIEVSGLLWREPKPSLLQVEQGHAKHHVHTVLSSGGV